MRNFSKAHESKALHEETTNSRSEMKPLHDEESNNLLRLNFIMEHKNVQDWKVSLYSLCKKFQMELGKELKEWLKAS